MPIKRSPGWLYYGFLVIVLIAAFAISVMAGSKYFSTKLKTVSIYDDGQVYEIRTMKSNVGNILEQANIDITENDYINVDKNEELKEDTNDIFIKRAVPVTISVDGKEIKVYTLKDDVLGVLEENNITLSSLDRIKDLSLTSEIKKDMKISIIRVTDEIVTEELTIPYQVIRQENPDMSIGEEKVITNGEVGKRVKTYRLLYEDGKEAGKELLKDETVAKPVNKVVEYGIVETFTTSRGSKVQYSKVYTMKSTSYTMEAMTNRPKDHPLWGITASGMKAQVGVIAVDRNIIPLGTKLYVEAIKGKDYGFAIAGDVGGFRGKHVDLYFDTLKECYAWGNKNVRVYVLRDQSVDIFKLRKNS